VRFDEFIKHVSERAEVQRDEAAMLTRAVLATLGERLTGGEADDLAAQLPQELKKELLEAGPEPDDFDLEEFIRRVAARTGVSEEEAWRASRAVMTTLREAITEGEFDDVYAQLPKEFNKLLDSPVS
jgi:uncharacterized protein (DUF2267 family)